MLMHHLLYLLQAFKFSGHSSPVNCIAFSPTSGRLIASASSDRSVRLWVNSVRGDSDSFRAHNAPVRSAHWKGLSESGVSHDYIGRTDSGGTVPFNQAPL